MLFVNIIVYSIFRIDIWLNQMYSSILRLRVWGSHFLILLELFINYKCFLLKISFLAVVYILRNLNHAYLFIVRRRSYDRILLFNNWLIWFKVCGKATSYCVNQILKSSRRLFLFILNNKRLSSVYFFLWLFFINIFNQVNTIWIIIINLFCYSTSSNLIFLQDWWTEIRLWNHLI